MLAYSGHYLVKGNTFVTKVDASWNEAWVGTEQVRDYNVDGATLTIMSPAQSNANFGGRKMRGVFTFQREETGPVNMNDLAGPG